MRQVAAHLAGDTILQTWVLDTLGKSLTIQAGVDEDNPPDPEEHYPIVVLVNCVMERGDRGEPILELQLGCGLVNSTTTETVGLIVYEGMLQVADFCHQVEASIFRSNLGQFGVEGNFIPISFHPLHTTNTVVRCTMVKSSRRAQR